LDVLGSRATISCVSDLLWISMRVVCTLVFVNVGTRAAVLLSVLPCTKKLQKWFRAQK
jgi:hypothetical protein